jgi:hypothetical protein
MIVWADLCSCNIALQDYDDDVDDDDVDDDDDDDDVDDDDVDDDDDDDGDVILVVVVNLVGGSDGDASYDQFFR